MFAHLFKKLSLSRNFGICIFNILSDLACPVGKNDRIGVPWWHPPDESVSGMNNPG